MIRAAYAIKLARTKLRARRGMLFSSVAISSLLFAIVVALIIIFTGAQKSAVTFIEKANNDKYFVQVQPVMPQSSIPGIDPTHLTLDNIKEVRAYEADYYANLKTKYKSLGLDYRDPSADDSLLTPDSFSPPGTPPELRYRLNFKSPLMTEFEQKKFIAYAATAKNTITDLQQVAHQYGGTGFYKSASYPVGSIPTQLLIQDGKENFSATDMKSGDMTGYGYFTNAIYNSMYGFQDDRLLSRYITPISTKDLKGIPVVVSAQEAVSLFGAPKGISKEPSADSEKPAWFRSVQQKLTGTTYQTCYRNSAEQTLLQKIQQDYADMQNHKSDKGYIKPSLLYAYPATPCGEITVQSDTRTKAEKDSESKQIAAQKKLGTYIAPSHRLITYQIVGFIEAHPYSEATSSVDNYVKNLLAYNSPFATDAIIPTQLYDALPDTMKIDDIADKPSDPAYTKAVASLGTTVIAFDTIPQARSFIDRETCPTSDLGCKKKFLSEPYGSNYLILDEISKLLAKAVLYILPVVLLLATIIIWFTMSRIMADNRRETAIYRAMGAKRRDIVAIYLTYTVFITLRIGVTSLLLGIFIAWMVNVTYGNQLSATTSIYFGIQGDTTPTFSLFDLSSPYIFVVPCLLFVVGLIAVAYPLLRNVRRSPIRDMREE